METDAREVALSRLREVEAQLRAFNRYTLLNEPELPKLLAEDVRKARESLEELTS